MSACGIGRVVNAEAQSPAPGSRTALLPGVVDALRTKQDAADARFFQDGLWLGASSGCWPCRVGPAVGAAQLVASRPDLLGVVTATMSRAIAEHRRPDGSFGEGDTSSPIDTGWFLNALGVTYLAVQDRLDPATRAAWAAVIGAGASYLVSTGQTSYYANGNVNLAYTEALWLAWRITGDPAFAGAYEASWTLTLHPPSDRFPGRGLQLSRQPTRDDWADGVGFLTEQEPGTDRIGFDPDYSQLQLDVASTLFVVSHDVRALRLMNVIINALLPRVGADLTLNAVGGVRRSSTLSLLTPALDVLAQSGSRPDLVALDNAQLIREQRDFDAFLRSPDGGAEPGFYRGVSTWLAVPVMAAQARTAAASLVSSAPQISSSAPRRGRHRSHPRRAASRRHSTSRHEARRHRRELRRCRAQLRRRTRAKSLPRVPNIQTRASSFGGSCTNRGTNSDRHRGVTVAQRTR
jgi:hypothetical protein